MERHTINKLSLLAEYDDISRHQSILTKGIETEFKLFLENQKTFREKMKSLESDNRKLQKKINTLETEKLRYETQLKHARSILITENEKNKKLELEKNSLARQIALIKELLADRNGIDNQTKERLFQLSSIHNLQNDNMRLTTIEESGSLLSSSDCDDTNDDLDYTKSKRFSDDAFETKHKVYTDVFSFDDEYTVKENTVPKSIMVTSRSSSEPNSSSIEVPVVRQVIRSDSDQVRLNASDIKRNSMNHGRSNFPNGRYSTGGKLSRPHSFVVKTYIRTEKCHPCGKIIRFCKQGLKCSDCRVSCHLECRDQCPLPCIAFITSPARKNLETITDFCSSTSPMIPSLIVHCVNEIESRGLEDIGLYRVPGREREVRELKEKFLKGKNVPSLKEIDIHVLCGTIKDFLRSLKESLITKDAWLSFTNAADIENENIKLGVLYDAVCKLPQANRDTLAFLLMHLQRVADSSLCQMPIENLSKMFGPTIVGYSADEPTDVNVLVETKLQNKVMNGLLKIPPETWQNLFSAENNFINSKSNTPERYPAPVTSRLGPIYTSTQMPTNFDCAVSTTISLRTTRTGRTGKKHKYFQSPILK